MGGFVAAVPRGAPADEALIARIIAASRDRAPDGVRHVVTPEGVLLVQCMFANTPESVGETLPLSDPSGRVWIVKRGHLNHIGPLRDRLRDRLGRDVRVHTDAEIMLAAYLAWGDEMAGELKGEFTLAIWDGREHRLVVLRDHLGLRGCYVHDGPEWFVAASEPAQVLPFPGVSDDLDEVAVADYISGWPTDRVRTFFQGVSRPLPATVLTVRDAAVVRRMYWQPAVSMEKATHPPEFYADEIFSCFERAVKSSLRSPTTVACDLSGGLDSSAVLGMAAKLRGEDPSSAELVAHSMVYPGLECDESTYINAVLRKWPVEWVGFAHNSAIEPSVRPQLVRSIDHPMPVITPGWAAQYEWIREKGVRVRFNGAGGDELFRTAPLPLARAVRPVGERWPYFWWTSRRSVRVLSTRVRREIILPALPPRLLSMYGALKPRPRSVRPALLTSRAEALRPSPEEWKDRRQAEAASEFWGPGDLLGSGLEDAFSLRWGHEVRSPLRDVDMLESVLGTPLLTHRWNGVWRSLQREVFAALFPPEVAERNTKAEFSLASLLAAGPISVGPELGRRGLVDTAAITEASCQAESCRRRGEVTAYPWELTAIADVDFWLTSRRLDDVC